GEFPDHIKLSEDFYWSLKATRKNVDFIGVPLILHRKRISSNQTSAKRKHDILENMNMIYREFKEMI
ncbi:MAG: hypothetical protein WD512_01915, partial [Candidatus Paceibacterota bacterium]